MTRTIKNMPAKDLVRDILLRRTSGEIRNAEIMLTAKQTAFLWSLASREELASTPHATPIARGTLETEGARIVTWHARRFQSGSAILKVEVHRYQIVESFFELGGRVLCSTCLMDNFGKATDAERATVWGGQRPLVGEPRRCATCGREVPREVVDLEKAREGKETA